MADVISRVMPGERFTAVLMNQLIEALVTLDQRIAALEGRGSVVVPPTAPVTITQLVPSSEVKVGDELRVFGTNFGYSSGAIHVAIGNTPITQFKVGTSDSTLVFNVPGLVDALPATLQVAVSNGATSAGRSIAVKPATDLSGNVSMEFTLIDAPDEGKTAKWRVRLTSQATRLATFDITSSVSQPEWQPGLDVLADAVSTTPITSVALTPNQQKDVYVKLAVPAGTPGMTFTLTFAVRSGAAGGTATSPTYTVGTVTPPVDTSSGATFGSVTGSNSHFNPATRKVTLKPGQNVTVTMNVSLSLAGTYKVTQTPAPDEQDGWILAPLQSDTFTVGATEVSGGQSAARQLKYKISAYGEALDVPLGKPARFIGGGPGTLEVTVRRQTQAGPSQPATMVIPFDNP